MKHYHALSNSVIGSTLLLLLLILAACSSMTGGGMSDDEKEIAIAVALTQTAAAIAPTDAPADAPADTSEDVPDDAATPMPATTTVAAEKATTTGGVAAANTTIESTAVVPTSPPSIILPANATAEATPDAALAATVAPLQPEQLPVTQNRAKVRSLLVAPGEPGALYALLTDEPLASEAATNAQLLVSENFGESWTPAPSGLPVANGCLFNINMDYYNETALYASTCEGIYRWAPGGEQWSLLAPEQTGMVAVVYGNDDILWATRPFQPEGAPVMLSQNGGESWQDIAMAHGNGVANFGISPRDSQSAYAIIWPESAGSYLRRGSMYNEWQIVPTPAENGVINTGMTIDGGVHGVASFRLLIGRFEHVALEGMCRDLLGWLSCLGLRIVNWHVNC